MLVRSCQRYKFRLLREAAKDKNSTKQRKKQQPAEGASSAWKTPTNEMILIGWKVEGPCPYPSKHTETLHTVQVHALSPSSSTMFLTAGIWTRPKAEKIFSQKPMTKTSPSTMFSRLCCTHSHKIQWRVKMPRSTAGSKDNLLLLNSRQNQDHSNKQGWKTDKPRHWWPFSLIWQARETSSLWDCQDKRESKIPTFRTLIWAQQFLMTYTK